MPQITRRSFLTAAGLAALALLTAGCAGQAAASEARSSRPRRSDPGATPAELAGLVADMQAFGLNLFRALRSGDGNVFFSPFSIAAALAMLQAGARGQTAAQIAAMLHPALPAERLHPAMNVLDLALASRASAEDDFRLTIANDVWGQQGFSFTPAFLDLLAEHYGAGMRLVDFQGAPDAGRRAINARVSDATAGKIRDLLPEGSITTLTRLVLTNAIYFKATWLSPFTREATSDGPFYPLAGGEVSVPLMRQQKYFGYAEGDGYQAVELPYHGGAAMLAILPAPEGLRDLEERLDAALLAQIVGALAPREIALTLPRVRLEPPGFSLRESLEQLGMADAFVPGTADLSGINGARDLFVSDGYHQATLLVDEEGTEAAAATALIAATTSAPAEQPIVLVFDRPFLLVIRDVASGAPLFLGRIAAPTA